VSKTAIICAHCGAEAYKLSGGVNRARRAGSPLYCSRACAGLAHRVIRTTAEAAALKADYDRRRRAELGEALLAEKRAAYRDRLARDPEGLRAAQKKNRDQRKGAHVEYCRRPEYRAWKKSYDRQHRAVKFFGPFADAFLALQDLETEIASRASRYEIYSENGTLNKCLKRKREHAKALSC
jgi:hypothetical protein